MNPRSTCQMLVAFFFLGQLNFFSVINNNNMKIIQLARGLDSVYIRAANAVDLCAAL